jgi:hypothetical protein
MNLRPCNAIASAFITLSLSGCVHQVGFHPVTPATEISSQTKAGVSLYIAPGIVPSEYSFRAAGSGVANSWVVDYGTRVHDYAVQYLSDAFGPVNEVDKPASGSQANVSISDVTYNISGQAAHVTIAASATDEVGEQILSERYEARGWSGSGAVFGGGAFAQKGVTRSSTDQALKEIFLKLVDDLRMALGISAQPVSPSTSEGQ